MSLAEIDLRSLEQRYPLTTTHFLQLPQGRESLAHVQSLDRRWATLIRGEERTALVHHGALPPTDADFDVVVAGGSLGLLAALSLARRGWRVMVFDQRVAGSAHREWNISQEEAQALITSGLFTAADLHAVAMRHYRTGLVRFAAGQANTHELWLDDVLDVAIDAGALLRLARARLEACGVKILDHREFRQVWLADSGPARSVVEVATAEGGVERYGARLLVNALGATSPLSLAMAATPFSGVCPTVGTVARGYATEGPHGVDLDLGEILVTTAHADDEGRRQLMWEGFPGRDEELTVYLFYYDLVDPARPQSLLDLFEVYFARLAEYKAPSPHFEHLRPVYGFIPSRHGAGPSVNTRGVLAVGDASAHQSPLTFCGFGSFVRNLERVASLADYALRHDRLEASDLAPISARQTNVGLMWVFARFMLPWRGGSEVNDMMNRFLAVLSTLGEDAVRRFFQDRTTWREYTLMLLRFALVFPTVLVWALEVLGWAGIGRWAMDYARFTWGAWRGRLLAWLGPRGRCALFGLASRLDTGWGLRVRAWIGEWEVSK
ncbi:MAG: hypothetical protein KIT87_14935 [Anaerolineae bacterium]|nr:hypothetical protein [Anaerolineae bacterium]